MSIVVTKPTTIKLAPYDQVPVFLHSMWRTGSTYLISRFAASDNYLPFYEPFHEYIGDAKARKYVAANYDRLRVGLCHPEVKGGLFQVYEERVTPYGPPLHSLYCPTSAIFDVYRGVSPKSLSYLEACVRYAISRGKRAVFGFCRSGIQAPDIAAHIPGHHIYLYRNPVEQFLSYGFPGKNDYFLPTTFLQLASSPVWKRAFREACDVLPTSAHLLLTSATYFTGLVPAKVSQIVARRALRHLGELDAFSVFYLSWLISVDAARRSGMEMVSLNNLLEDSTRARFEHTFGIVLKGLRSTKTAYVDEFASRLAKKASDIQHIYDHISSQNLAGEYPSDNSSVNDRLGPWPHTALQ